MKIIKHLKSDWFRYGFETLAVLVGLLAAFALESWKEERKSVAHYFSKYASTARVSDVYGISTKYLDDPREKPLVNPEKLVDDHILETLVLVRLVQSDLEKELYQNLLESASSLRNEIELTRK